MVLLSDAAGPQAIDLADGVVSDIVLEASQRATATWLPVRGDLVSVLVELGRHPGFSFVSVGETADGLQRSYYLARAVHNGQYFVGYCAFHLTGARIRAHARDLVAAGFEVLVGPPEEFRWKRTRYETGLGDSVAVDGGWTEQRGSSQVERSLIVRYRSQEVFSYGSLSSGHAFETFNIHPSPVIDFEDVDHYEVLTIAKNPQTQGSGASPQPEDRLKVITGRYYSWNFCNQVKKGDRHSTAVNFPNPLKSVPQVVMGFDYLDMTNPDSALRLRLYPQNITKESFICNMESWNENKLFNGGATWAVINEPGWQAGILMTKPPSDGSSFENRVTFATPFTSLPMVFVCFNGFDLTGTWDLRVQATSIDHAGFSISVFKPGSNVCVSSTSWIAIPGDDILKRKNACIGRFSTEMGKRVAGKDGEWSGHTNFGFDFKRTPKIFLGVDQVSSNNERYLRLSVSTSKVSQSGMDWYIKKWNNSILRSAGVSFLALDCV